MRVIKPATKDAVPTQASKELTETFTRANKDNWKSEEQISQEKVKGKVPRPNPSQAVLRATVQPNSKD